MCIPCIWANRSRANTAWASLDYVHDLRIEEARRLLARTDMTLGAIAEAVGYNAYQHFLKQFERRTGMKPAAYRTLAGRASHRIVKTDSTS